MRPTSGSKPGRLSPPSPPSPSIWLVPRSGTIYCHKVGLAQAIFFRLLVQYFVNPDNYYPLAPAGRPKDGIEVGFFAVASLGRLLGTSLKPN